jgi:hypothetical protein
MLIGFIKYKLAKQKVINNYRKYAEVEHDFIVSIINHYFDYFEFLKSALMRRYEYYFNKGMPQEFLKDCEFYTAEIDANRATFEQIMNENKFQVRVIKSMLKKGLFDGKEFKKEKNYAVGLVNHFYTSLKFYEENFKRLSPNLMAKEYIIQTKLKSIGDDF